MNNAIRLAIEKGGYSSGNEGLINKVGRWQDTILLDRQFWKCLGKALGLKDTGTTIDHLGHHNYWLPMARQFFELTLTQGDTEAFWKELLK